MAAQRAGDRAYVTLRAEIIEGELAPGTVLLETEQASRLGVSRTPLREALGRLSNDGLVTAQTGRGLVVSPVSIDDIRELYELRLALEQQAARLAAERRDPAVFRALAAEFQRTSEHLGSDDGVRAYYELIDRFDAAVDAAIDNNYLVGALGTVRTHLARIRRLARSNPERLAAAAHEHALIIDAIVAGDATLAAHATHVHLHQSLRTILANAESLRTPTDAASAA